MRRLVAASGAAILAVGLGVVGTTVGTAGVAQSADERSPVAIANQYIDDHRGAVKGSGADDYRAVGTIAGPDGSRHIRYERTYHGLPVLGGDFVVHQTANGSVDDVSVAQSRSIDLSTAPTSPACPSQSSSSTLGTALRSSRG
jgi:Zn-dependent metalloprotease